MMSGDELYDDDVTSGLDPDPIVKERDYDVPLWTQEYEDAIDRHHDRMAGQVADDE